MRSLLPPLLLLISATPALATDGELEINQSCAVQTGCFAGDTAGFPVTIGSAGSYRLTGNLALPANTTAIRIATSNVTLDLGGFEVKGPNTCSGYPVTACVGTGGAAGIESITPNEYLVVVRNGNVAGMSGRCVSLEGNSSRVEGITAVYCGGVGIYMGTYGRVTESFSGNNFDIGIMFGEGGTADRNESRGNRGTGIFGALTAHTGSMIQNRSFDNLAFGYASGANGALMTGNVAAGNGAGAKSGGQSAGDNLCNGTLC